MDERLLQLLRVVVEEYIATAEPVGSQTVVDGHHFDVSSATIRNWFAELDEAGYLKQPHTSGGRVPTEAGYRLYVERFVIDKPAGKREREALAKAAKLPTDAERQLKNMAKSLAEQLGLAVFLELGQEDTFYTGLSQLFAQPEFKDSEQIVNVSGTLDRLDEALAKLHPQTPTEPQILIGEDCPFGDACSVVMVAADGRLIGILGPMRMEYQSALSLMNTILTLLNE